MTLNIYCVFENLTSEWGHAQCLWGIVSTRFLIREQPNLRLSIWSSTQLVSQQHSSLSFNLVLSLKPNPSIRFAVMRHVRDSSPHVFVFVYVIKVSSCNLTWLYSCGLQAFGTSSEEEFVGGFWVPRIADTLLSKWDSSLRRPDILLFLLLRSWNTYNQGSGCHNMPRGNRSHCKQKVCIGGLAYKKLKDI